MKTSKFIASKIGVSIANNNQSSESCIEYCLYSRYMSDQTPG